MTSRFAQSFIDKYLDPAESLSEVLFGVIMTLTFTLGAGILVRADDASAAQQLLIAALGCNVAWGTIDAAMYLGGQLFERGRLMRLGRAIRVAPDEASSLALVASEFDELMLGVSTPEERERLYRAIAANVRARPARGGAGLGRADFWGALASFWLVVLSSIPAAIPFLLIADARRALRVSNALLLALLFLVGYRWARHTPANPWLVGTGLLVAGVALVALAIQLGG
ncbi:MAG: VIT family protein [Myxococcota bacterium]